MSAHHDPRPIFNPWCRSAIRTLRLIYGSELTGKRIVDLGCLEGGFALEFARIGMESVGIEVRSSNFNSCLTVKERAGLSNLEFFQDDVWNVERYGTFDAIFCSGLLYHLDRPQEFLHLLSKITKDAILLDTHYAPWKMFGKAFGLSAMAENEKFPGRWYPEHDLKAGEQALDQLKWASWENNCF